MSTKVVTGKVRFAFPHVFSAYAFRPGDDEKYSITILIPKSDSVTVGKIKAAIKEATDDGITSKWKGKKPANLWNPLRDGDERAVNYPEYEGMYFINCKGSMKPTVLDRDKNEILDPGEVYSGCYGRVSISFFPFDNSGNRGVAAGLNHVQKLSDGPRLDGRSSAEDDFADDFEDEEEEF